VPGMTVLLEMPLGEGAAGTGLQVLLERDRTIRIRELDKRHELPRPECRGVLGATAVMHRKAPLHVVRDSDVIAIPMLHAAKNVDDVGVVEHE
jgi:hypothetical protein